MKTEWMSCPKCKSESLTADHFESDENCAWRVVTCDNCGFEWQEVFNFDHNENLNADELNENGDEK